MKKMNLSLLSNASVVRNLRLRKTRHFRTYLNLTHLEFKYKHKPK